MSQQPLRSRPPAVLSALGVFALVAALVVTEPPAPASATPPAAARPAAWHAASAVPPANWMDSVSGSQTRMLQVGLVVIAIGVFLLSRSVR